MLIHSVTIDDGRVTVLHDDGQHMDYKAAIACAYRARDISTLMDLVGRLEALAVQERAMTEATPDLLALCTTMRNAFGAYPHHTLPPGFAKNLSAAIAKAGGGTTDAPEP